MSMGQEFARKVVNATVNTVLGVAEAPGRAFDRYQRDAYIHGDGLISWRRSAPATSVEDDEEDDAYDDEDTDDRRDGLCL